MRGLDAVFFDVDGVLTTVDSVWQFIHQRLGTAKKAARYREMYKRGEITYEQWALLDAHLWRGVTRRRLMGIVDEIKLREGAREAILFLKSRGLVVGAISAGLDLVADNVCKRLGIDVCVANKLIFEGEVFTGAVKVLVEYNNKGEVLRRLADKLGLKLERTAAVGDSEVDISMFRVVGFPIAYNPSSTLVEKHASYVIKDPTLHPLIDLFREILDR